MKTFSEYELELEDFWNGGRYYLTNGIDYITKKQYMRCRKQNKKIYVISDEHNIFDLEFKITKEAKLK